MIDPETKRVALLCTRGLPASYGAFEQCVDQICRLAETNDPLSVTFVVGSEASQRKKSIDHRNVIRIFCPRFGGLGVLVYGFLTTIHAILMRCKTLVFFGYSMAPLFPVLSVFGFKVVVNVDGFEWRRRKWNKTAKLYFKVCEAICGRSNVTLISDAHTIQRYYRIKYRKNSSLIRYGSEKMRDMKPVSVDFSKYSVQAFQYLVVVMRLEPENNIEEIFQGFLSSDTCLKLLVIGPSTPFFEKKLEACARESDRISYIGSVYDRPTLFALRSHAAIYIHGHSVGGTNPTLVEACEIGQPIIAYDSVFNREVLGNDAVYFKSSSDLEKILSHRSGSIPAPPNLDASYQWATISQQYMNAINLKD